MIAWILWTLTFSVLIEGAPNTENNILFLDIGETTSSATYAHIAISLDFNVYWNHTVTLRQYVAFCHKKLNEIRRRNRERELGLYEDLEGVPSMVNSYSKKLSLFKTLFHMPNDERSKRQAMVALGLASLINFGISAYSITQLQSIGQDVNRLDEEVSYIVYRKRSLRSTGNFSFSSFMFKARLLSLLYVMHFNCCK